MNKPREDSTNRYRLNGIKELLYESLEIGQTALTITENEIVLAVLVENLSFLQIADQRNLTWARVQQIYTNAFKKLAKKVRTDKHKILELPVLEARIFELESLIRVQSERIDKYNANGDFFNSLLEKTKQLLDTNIVDVNLTARVKNMCRPNDIITVSDLVKIGPVDLLKMRNVGKGTLKEIETFLAENNLKWNMIRE